MTGCLLILRLIRAVEAIAVMLSSRVGAAILPGFHPHFSGTEAA